MMTKVYVKARNTNFNYFFFIRKELHVPFKSTVVDFIVQFNSFFHCTSFLTSQDIVNR